VSMRVVCCFDEASVFWLFEPASQLMRIKSY
jgi:hypothetical protein